MVNIEVILAKSKEEQEKFLNFRRNLYKFNRIYADNNLFMIRELFSGKTSFLKNINMYPIYVEHEKKILCQGIVIYARGLPEYIQLSFFESNPNEETAVSLLLDETVRLGRKSNCKRLVVGLNGHVNYGLGLLCSNYEEKNSFSSAGNPKYYNDYLKKLEFEEIGLNTYIINNVDNRLERYSKVINKINQNYTFRFFDKSTFDYYSKIFTDLNNDCFARHKYYYKRNYDEDKEMLKELLLFMREDSLIFAFKGDKPVGFIMWYPDYNELIKAGNVFGASEFIKNVIFGKSIKRIKIMEYGVIDEYRKNGLPLGLINQMFIRLKKHNISSIETSWVLKDNKDSNSFCTAICDEFYKGYAVYEKSII